MSLNGDEKSIELRRKLISAGEIAVEELIQVAEHKINFVTVKPTGRSKKSESDESEAESFAVAADKLKTAAQAKKLAIMDAFEILNKIQSEREILKSLESKVGEKASSTGGFAEKRARESRS